MYQCVTLVRVHTMDWQASVWKVQRHADADTRVFAALDSGRVGAAAATRLDPVPQRLERLMDEKSLQCVSVFATREASELPGVLTALSVGLSAAGQLAARADSGRLETTPWRPETVDAACVEGVLRAGRGGAVVQMRTAGGGHMFLFPGDASERGKGARAFIVTVDGDGHARVATVKLSASMFPGEVADVRLFGPPAFVRRATAALRRRGPRTLPPPPAAVRTG